LFDDPFAAAFVAAMPDAYSPQTERSDAAELIRTRIALQVVVRTKFYDDYLLAAAADGIRQIVLLAAGLDTRAFRLPWPDGTTVFEVDLPETTSFKNNVLAGLSPQPTTTRQVVVADLTADWPTTLTAADFDVSQPTAWLIEGLLVYLSHDDAARLLGAVAELSAPGSRLSCEQGRGVQQLQQMAAARSAAGASEAVALWQGGIEDVSGWLDRHGWTTEKHDLGALAETYGRGTAIESSSGFVIARR
jgi:methyltransferase (TIGR00027 family)